MTLNDAKTLFQTELNGVYSTAEINQLHLIFLEKLTGLNRLQVRSESEKELDEDSEKYLRDAVAQLKTGRPFQQILGETEFFGLTFFVDENVLIPRPETEELLELAIAEIRRSFETKAAIKILDIGTGSGIIPIVLKKHFPEAEIGAIDIFEPALKTASRNAELHQADIHFIHQDYLNNDLEGVFDVIISNPPYIGLDEETEIEDSVKGFEPTMALFSPTSNALVFYEKIAEDCVDRLSANGLVFLEINQKLGPETLALFTDVLSYAELVKDISGNDRFVWGRK